jgi:uncharacterized protein YrrD
MTGNKSSHTVFNDTIPQNINILIFNLHKRKISVYYNPDVNKTISRQASTEGALAAVNGGFFDIKNGGSATYIRTRGFIADKDTGRKWTRNSNMTGSILIDSKNSVIIESARTNSY